MPEMGEPVSEVHIDRENNMGKWILLALAIIYVAGSLYLTFSLRAHVDKLSKDYTAGKVQIAELTRRVQSAEANDLGSRICEGGPGGQGQHHARDRCEEDRCRTSQPGRHDFRSERRSHRGSVLRTSSAWGC